MLQFLAELGVNTYILESCAKKKKNMSAQKVIIVTHSSLLL